MKGRKLYVCAGSSCRKALGRDPRLLSVVDALGVEVERVRCQKICDSPVVGTELSGELEWFGRMGSKKAQSALARLVSEGELKKPLAKRREPKRQGRLR
ncbi:MAG TPA: (2Fe-2S) ferredoxin domain-containing protein [Polyangiaceae bacterium LLY-WYZ-14_1]|jgi:hypothetical protein|nr:(2Fe-2S) ferredoxin domain-containing protein [Polyangiaceae bacterium LLY-WYZ-14_1]